MMQVFCTCWQAWEYGLPLCEELAGVYKKKILYEDLGRILVSDRNEVEMPAVVVVPSSSSSADSSRFLTKQEMSNEY